MFWAFLLWQRRLTPFIGFMIGLSLGNHLILLLALPLLLFVEKKRLLLTGICILLGLCIYLWLPLRDVPASNWGNPDTPARLWAHISGEIYRRYQFAGDYQQNLMEWADQLVNGFGILLLLLPLGWWELWQSERRFLMGSIVSFGAVTIYRAGYVAEGVDAYWLLPNALLVMWTAAGAARWFRQMDRRFALLLLVFPAVQVVMNIEAMNLRDDTGVETFLVQALDVAPPDAVILSDDEKETFALWYAVYAEGRRPDVWIIDVRMVQWRWYVNNLEQLYPELEPFPENDTVTVQLIERHIPENRPVLFHLLE
jgi:hypothetical protein